MGGTVETVRKLCQQGLLSEAVQALGVLVQADCPISKTVFSSVLGKCVGKKDVGLGRRVHALIVKRGYESDSFLCNHIVRMYAFHGLLQEAMDVFTTVAVPDAFMWSAIISGHVKHGQAKGAIQLYHEMRRSSVKPDGYVFVAALQACSKGADLKSGQQVHADVLGSGVQLDLFVCNALVDMYAKCGSLEEAQRVFDGLQQKDVVTWTALIVGYSQHAKGEKALHLYSAMQQEGMTAPNIVTFVSLLHACASLGTSALEKGKQLHAQIRERGLEADVTVSNNLINMYAKCGSLEDAQSVFDKIPQKNVVTWTGLIAGYSQQGMGQEGLRLYSAMQESGLTPNAVTFVSLLQACASLGPQALEKGKQLHAQIGEEGLQADVVVGSSLVNMYAKCGSLQDARDVFDGLCQKDVVTWNGMIAGYSQQGMGQEALHLYSAMQQEGIVAPNASTFVCLLQACASLGAPALETGKQLHAHMREQGVKADIVVGSSLVNMYAKCGSLEDAQRVFDRLGHKDVVTWNAMIAGYSQQGLCQQALDLYSAMQQQGNVAPSYVTFVCLLQACASAGTSALEQGKQLHAHIRGRGLEAHLAVGNNLINMYAKCGSLEDAQSVFEELPEKNVVTWTALIAGYSQHGRGQKALHLYSAMQEVGIAAPNAVTFVCLLQACASVGTQALETGKQLHAQIGEQGLQADVVVGCSLVNMYAKCGSIQDAQSVFDVGEKDVVTWNAMIAGYSQQGMVQEALDVYSAMQQEGIDPPDAVTFVCLLQACASVGDLQVGARLHAQVEEQKLQTDLTVGNSLINMYAKFGYMVDAQKVFDAMPERDVVTWNALIAGYTRQGDSELVFDLVHRMRGDGIQPNGITFLSLLTVCSHAGLVPKGQEYFEAMRRDFGITPTVEHYSCMVDLLGRAGQLEEALTVVRTMPLEPHDAVWHSLLGACQKWSNVDMGRLAFGEALKLDEKDAAAYVLMSNIYTGAQMWEEAQQIQARRREVGARKPQGQSWWTDMDGLVHSFSVGDTKHPDNEGIYARLRELVPKMINEGYVP